MPYSMVLLLTPYRHLFFSKIRVLTPNLHGTLGQKCISTMVTINSCRHVRMLCLMLSFTTLLFPPNRGSELIFLPHLLAFRHQHTVGLCLATAELLVVFYTGSA